MIMKCSSIPLAGNYSTCQRITKDSMLSVVMLPLTSPSSTPALLSNHLRYCFISQLLSSKGFSSCVGPWPSPFKLFTSVDKPVDKLTTFAGVKPLA